VHDPLRQPGRPAAPGQRHVARRRQDILHTAEALCCRRSVATRISPSPQQAQRLCVIICAWPSCRQPSRLLRGCWDIICDRGRITLCHVTQPKWRHRQAPAAPQIIVQPAPVIIQQPPAATPAPPEPPAPHKHPGWSRGWSIGKVAGPALGTLAALVISLMSYSASHDANKLAARDEAAARATAKEQAAAQVSWYSPSRRQTVIVNASDSTISLPILYESSGGCLAVRLLTTSSCPMRPCQHARR
jgi:hypothetical protein